MKKIVTVLVITFISITTPKAKADMWGGDLIYLAQILTNTIKQLVELKNIVETGKDQLDLLKEINKGINDSLKLAQTINPNIDPGLYKDWKNISDAIQKLQTIYGVVTDSPNAQVYRDTDQQIAEAIQLNNDIHAYTKGIDQLGEVIKDFSHEVSPGGAQKLTAQTMGVMLQVMNQNLRSQGIGLKLQAQSLALQNKKEKDSTKQYLESANTLRMAMKNDKIIFKAPRF